MSLEFRNIENLVSKFTQQIHISEISFSECIHNFSVAVPTVQLKYLNINTSNVIFDILVFTSTSDFQKFRDFGRKFQNVISSELTRFFGPLQPPQTHLKRRLCPEHVAMGNSRYSNTFSRNAKSHGRTPIPYTSLMTDCTNSFIIHDTSPARLEINRALVAIFHAFTSSNGNKFSIFSYLVYNVRKDCERARKDSKTKKL